MLSLKRLYKQQRIKKNLSSPSGQFLRNFKPNETRNNTRKRKRVGPLKLTKYFFV